MAPDDKDVDRLIREALSREESELYDRLGPPALHEMVLDLFRGRHRWFMVWSFIMTLVFLGVGIWCVVRFLEATEVRDMLMWSCGFLFCMLAVMANKLWSWMEMHRNMLSREIKRLELQIAHLANELRRNDS